MYEPPSLGQPGMELPAGTPPALPVTVAAGSITKDDAASMVRSPLNCSVEESRSSSSGTCTLATSGSVLACRVSCEVPFITMSFATSR